jgi:hypothetical protein
MRIKQKRQVTRARGHLQNRTAANVGSNSVMTARDRRGKRTGILLVAPVRQLGYNTGYQRAYYIFKKMQPIRVPPARILNGAGRHVAMVVVNPITGSRHRLPVAPFTQGDR